MEERDGSYYYLIAVIVLASTSFALSLVSVVRQWVRHKALVNLMLVDALLSFIVIVYGAVKTKHGGIRGHDHPLVASTILMFYTCQVASMFFSAVYSADLWLKNTKNFKYRGRIYLLQNLANIPGLLLLVPMIGLMTTCLVAHLSNKGLDEVYHVTLSALCVVNIVLRQSVAWCFKRFCLRRGRYTNQQRNEQKAIEKRLYLQGLTIVLCCGLPLLEFYLGASNVEDGLPSKSPPPDRIGILKIIAFSGQGTANALLYGQLVKGESRISKFATDRMPFQKYWARLGTS